jgi:SNF2 family DNA or RNA helicase
MELWAVMTLVAPGLLPPSPKAFDEVYRRPIERARDGVRLAALRRRIAPLVLRRTKEQVAQDLPAKTEQVLEVDLVPAHRRAYDAFLARERTKVLGLVEDLPRNKFKIFRSLTLLRQAALDISLVDPQAQSVPATKLDLLVELVGTAVAQDHRVLVFSQFTRFLTAARGRLAAAGLDVRYLDGRTRRRAEVVEGFRGGGAPVFLISLKAGGTGLTLTEADYCIVLDPWWNPATENQAVDRAHRIGQTRPVLVHRLVARDTIEEKVMQLKSAKAGLFASVFDGSDLASAALTAEDVERLVG